MVLTCRIAPPSAFRIFRACHHRETGKLGSVGLSFSNTSARPSSNRVRGVYFRPEPIISSKHLLML
jgi:hypothetical protein